MGTTVSPSVPTSPAKKIMLPLPKRIDPRRLVAIKARMAKNGQTFEAAQTAVEFSAWVSKFREQDAQRAVGMAPAVAKEYRRRANNDTRRHLNHVFKEAAAATGASTLGQKKKLLKSLPHLQTKAWRFASEEDLVELDRALASTKPQLNAWFKRVSKAQGADTLAKKKQIVKAFPFLRNRPKGVSFAARLGQLIDVAYTPGNLVEFDLRAASPGVQVRGTNKWKVADRMGKKVLERVTPGKRWELKKK